MDQMKLFIPTYNRVGKQHTIKQVPERWKSRVFLVCPEGENHDWPNVIHTPEEVVGHIGKIRQWICEQADTPYVGMLDDDLTQYIRYKDGEKYRTRKCTEEEVGELFDLLEKWLQEGDVYCGTSNSFMSHERDDEYFYGKPSHCCFLNRDYLAEHNIRYDVLRYFEDFHVPLSVLKSGKRLHYTGNFITKEKQANAEGGCSTNRTGDTNRKAMIAFHNLHKDYVVLKEEKGATNQNLEVGVKLTIRFKKCYDDQVVNRLENDVLDLFS